MPAGGVDDRFVAAEKRPTAATKRTDLVSGGETGMTYRCRRFIVGMKLGGRAGLLRLGLTLGLIVLGFRVLGGGPESTPLSQEPKPLKSRVAFYASLPLSFERNQGQADQRVKFLARGLGYTLFLTSDEAVLAPRGRQSSVVSGQLQGNRNSKFETRNSAAALRHPTPDTRHPIPESPVANPESRATDVLRMKLLAANRSAQVTPLDELPGKSNYFLGNDPKKWRTHVPTYAKVKYHGIYPGIDLIYYGPQRQLEYDFVVNPGADLGAIALAVETGNSKMDSRLRGNDRHPRETRPLRRRGSVDRKSKIAVDSNGDLVVGTDGGQVRFHKPRVYQPRALANGSANSEFTIQNSQFLDGRYVLTADNRIRFEIPFYDKTRPLVIDPVLSYSTYLGGSGGDVAYGIAVDSSGSAYVTGSTGSVNFPVKSYEQGTMAGSGDAFVTKFNPTGSGLIYSTYLGGSGSDFATSMVIDSAGNVYLAGSTSSPDFPTTSGVLQQSYTGNGDAFLAKLDATGSTLSYSTYLGGTAADYAQGITIDSSGNAYVTGSTESPDFPTASPLQIGNDGCTTVGTTVSCSADLFISKVNPSGTELVYSTYLGGSGADTGRAIAVDTSGNAYIAGYTSSSNYPTQSALQSTSAGGTDAFITELNAAGSALVYSTYLGGSKQDRAFGLALDSQGSVYVTGDTQSLNFPTTSTAFQTANNGQGDVFVSKLAPGGTSIVYSTLLGGTGTDQGAAIALDPSKDAYITGFTQSSDFPLSDPLQKILGLSGAGTCATTPCPDAFVSELGPSGAVLYSTYLGGSGADVGQAIAVDSSGAAYVAGSTTSANFPVIGGAAQASFAGSSSSSNAFVAKVSLADAPGVALTPQQINFGNQALNNPSNPQSVLLVNAGSAALDISSIVGSGDFTQTDNCGSTVPGGGGNCTIQITFTPTTTGTRTDQISITDNAAGSPHVITVTGTGVLTGGQLSLSPTSLTFPPEPVGTTSPAQQARLTNTGTTAVTVTAISISGDFAQTNTCGTLPAVLNVGASCTISVTFTPAGSGNLSGSVTVTDDAANTPQALSLTGTGNPAFTLSATARSTVVVIGSTSVTFTVSASAPSSFTSSIALTCSAASGATCTFNPSSILAGETSTLTVSGLYDPKNPTAIPNPLNITATGTAASQTVNLPLTVFFSDFSLTASPALNSVVAGNSITYTVNVAPKNGFNQVVLLSCAALPANTTCTWTPPGVSLDGLSTASATVSVNTTAPTTTGVGFRPPGGSPPKGPRLERNLWLTLLVILTLMGILTAVSQSRRRPARARIPLRASLLVLALLATFLVAQAACTNYYYNPISPANPTGTPAGTYSIAFVGTLGNNSTVTRATTVNMSVSP